jgi:(4S)-4-hydroxy-5-phosphonooxypentane-2,3-dione isomerase
MNGIDRQQRLLARRQVFLISLQHAQDRAMNPFHEPNRLLLLLALLVSSSRSVFSFASVGPAFGVSQKERLASVITSLRAGAGGVDRPFAVIVEAEIEPDRMGEFLELIENNAKETRKEPGCVRFDVLRSQEADNRFYFFELYRTAGAIEHHKEQPHYGRWADFKASGGVIRSTTHKADGEFVAL